MSRATRNLYTGGSAGTSNEYNSRSDQFYHWDHLHFQLSPLLREMILDIQTKMPVASALQFLWVILIISITSAQQVFIDSIPAYSSLDACAVGPLSTIVRDMSYGCGDGSHTTSYGCFCTSSSSYFSAFISSNVLNQCGGNVAEATSAVDVFNAYCQLGGSNSSSTNSRVHLLVSISLLIHSIEILILIYGTTRIWNIDNCHITLNIYGFS